ncbi:serine/threonine-protein kinase HipA [Chitinophaga sp. CF118]|uniref:type II toxin-antitoxin system HipA family toxin n=1 Tax=Chitinophaga sp. CF118 TaxID=1884367 RepID=UPI0008EEAE53|nr:HipA domain-containing protein [Chitinophaga sp. CF118]SFE97984.1 serine/threonine-protein kinase HipA [Chitinophaga sp. CF118]
MCPGCYKENVDGYCTTCLKKLFDGKKVSHILPFDAPKDENYKDYQDKTRKLSISGVQLKYSLKLDGKELQLAETGGEYILKPIPPSVQIINTSQAPENEHLTMQIASQIFDIDTADNALIYFKDGTPAYITRRFDINPEGGKFLQEDMAQINGKTKQSHGENFKYEGDYEEIGKLISKFVPASMPSLEAFFKLLVFNYVFSNGDAHLKNFSLIQSPMGDYTLSRAYDLMCTELHTPDERETAIDLYEGDDDNEFYARERRYGQVSFRELAKRLGIQSTRVHRIINNLLTARDKVESMINSSMLNEKSKANYLKYYHGKLSIMGMTEIMIANALDINKHDQFPSDRLARITFFRPRRTITGKFINKLVNDTPRIENNLYYFVESEHIEKYDLNQDEQYLTIIEGDAVISVEPFTPAAG